jgi:amino-acid N-acetyltransferase
LAAWLDDEIVGTGALIHRSRRIAEIARVSVALHVRRHGVGHGILDALINHAHKKGYHKIILETTETWRGVIDFYLSYGFQTTHNDYGNVYFKLEIH